MYLVKQMEDGRWIVYERRGKKQEWFVTSYISKRNGQNDARQRNANRRDSQRIYREAQSN